MSERNLVLAQRLLGKLGDGAPVEDFTAFLSENLIFEVAGDATALPWIGAPRAGRQAFTDFIRDQRELVRADAFRVDEILHSETRAVILGELSSTVRRTGRSVRTSFVLILTISDGEIVRFQMLEDSHAVSRAAH